jgi:hypothetical protein
MVDVYFNLGVYHIVTIDPFLGNGSTNKFQWRQILGKQPVVRQTHTNEFATV